MPGSQSSREHSLAASESERKAKAAAQRKAQIREQIQALVAQEQEADEEEKAYLNDFHAEGQAAREEKFHNATFIKQKEFRDHLSDEVWTRVAKQLSPDDQGWIASIARRSEGLEDPVLFKSVIFNVLVGEDADFLSDAARKILDRVDRSITDEDVAEIEASVACLKQGSSSVFRSVSDSTSPHRDYLPIEKAEVTSRIECESPSNATGDGTPLIQAQLSAYPPPKFFEELVSVPGEIREDDDPQNEEDLQEDNIEVADQRPLADEIERKSVEIQAIGDQVISEFGDTDGGGILLKEDSGNHLPDRRLPASPTREAGSKESTSRKRSRKESVTSCNATQPKTPKKTKTAASAGSEPPRVKAFVEHIKGLARNDILSASDFQCATCKQDISKDARVGACGHLYDAKCLRNMRKEAHGSDYKGAKRVPCMRVGCDKDVGRPAKIGEDEVEKLKTEHLSADKGMAEEWEEVVVEGVSWVKYKD